jgi:hypothetical protein
MTIMTYNIDQADIFSTEALVDAFAVRDTQHEKDIRGALSIQQRPFTLRVDVDPDSPAEIPPLHDAFTFDMESDELILFSDEPAKLVDALIEMALFMRGFNTTIGVDDDWKTQVTIGTWRRIRERLKLQLGIRPLIIDKMIANLNADTVKYFNHISFHAMVFMASCVDLEVIFPDGANKQVMDTYRRLVRIMETVTHNVSVDDYLTFNRRLGRALQWIEETVLPKEDTFFDDLFGSDGFTDIFFDDSNEAP